MVTILRPRTPKRGSTPPSITDEEIAGMDVKPLPGAAAEKGIELSEPAIETEGTSSTPGAGPNPTK